MSTGNKTVILPDGTTLNQFPDTFSAEQIRQALIATGNQSVANATYEVSADGRTVKFLAPQGGRKGN